MENIPSANADIRLLFTEHFATEQNMQQNPKRKNQYSGK
jgi:hypothetical protein